MLEEEYQFTDQKTFSMHIEEVVITKKINHVEAVLDYCKTNFLDPEDITKLLSDSVKEKIRANFIDMNYLKKTARFDI